MNNTFRIHKFYTFAEALYIFRCAKVLTFIVKFIFHCDFFVKIKQNVL